MNNKDLIFQKYNNIKNNINRIKEKYNINYNIEIVAVSKYASLENIKEFLNLNLDLPLAESKAQSLRDRVGELEKFNKNLNIKWHFIGRIQSNKIKYIVKFADLIQSVDSVEIAELINKEAQKNNKIQNILLQFNISFENQKGGFNLSDYKNIYEQILKMKNIKIKGLMGIASNSEEKNLIENEFEKLNKIFNDINLEFDKNKISILSMGMTSDYELAIKHGSNMIRIGSGLLGNS
ncbi:YggS family pyridoxal phosphate-dependent enzyme [Brachyspira aalborgi]|uniref:Pyridoxal phosphate homeostasis protein n=1 Tax=Brachyspira aalborgi TaxID=29522 RepID=A0A5C8ET28_9SPIR|nr:YggS family pyridoxal phosphate-dependent enzyme [Brachyspira aalborgi]MBS4763740.1 YggS family pyridoxal phosphate-dependent enzyme [Brachyspira sp.]CCY75260.1 alanine racemase domain protein [Brachyspira sp. CAG:700]TXJ15875.1 YggS family pyridoxal phosphate-dependent enzyme [Brachyspira aalborgi]TXJ19375.1 YggS family pyridoxal phosphate-dependent enzyme [Brachyspira aalborgi]TXJ26126.1 YggS family pyridoxal phosphate-dependent enzyme [Brachyspira aalborgi]